MISDFVNGLHIALLLITLFVGSLFYFRIAEHYKLMGRPVGSDAPLMVRGGGVLFILALVCWFSLYRLSFPWFVIGTLLVGAAGFIDDIRRQPLLLRIGIQVVAFSMIGWQTGFYHQQWWIVGLIFVIGIGAVNAFNSMDGINGMTGAYALANLMAFWYINEHIIHFSYTSLIAYMMVAVIVFLYFNFRVHARWFAGHVGSASLAFIQIFLLMQLIGSTQSFKWTLVFLVYGVDAVVTIVYRLRHRQNIFVAHRSHLYQYLSNEMGVPQLMVSFGYGLLQFIVNLLLIGFLHEGPGWISIVVILVVGISYVWVRERVLKRMEKGT